jgi:acyl carrier protein
MTTSDTTAADPVAILAALQRAFDAVMGERTRELAPADDLAADLQLDSLDFIDLIMTLGEEIPPAVLDVVIERAGDLRTVGDVVDAIGAGHD